MTVVNIIKTNKKAETNLFFIFSLSYSLIFDKTAVCIFANSN